MRIAHVSDLHLHTSEDIPLARFFNKRVTGLLNLKLKRNQKHRPAHLRAVLRHVRTTGADHVAITGDLTNLALEQEFAAVRELVETELGMSPRDVSIVPGNHDLYTRGALRDRRFSEYFADYIAGDLPELVSDVALGPFPYVKLRGPLAIVGLTSAVPRPPLVAAGEVGARQRAALIRIFEHPEVRSRTPLVLMHHPPHNPASQAKAFAEGLRDAHLLDQQLTALPRGLVIHGHLHRRLRFALTATVTSVGATSASLHHIDDDRMAGINIYDIDDRTGEVTDMRALVYAPDDSSFRVRDIPLGGWH